LDVKNIKRVLGIIEEYGLNNNEIFWSYDEEEDTIEFYANCSDTFFWGSADGEPRNEKFRKNIFKC
jgi:hypothetical protein